MPADFNVFSLKKPLQLVHDNQNKADNQQQNSNCTNYRNTNVDTNTNRNPSTKESAPRDVEASFAQLKFSAYECLRRVCVALAFQDLLLIYLQNISIEVWYGQVNGTDAYLKANTGPKDVLNEISIYSYLKGQLIVFILRKLTDLKIKDSFICQRCLEATHVRITMSLSPRKWLVSILKNYQRRKRSLCTRTSSWR